MVVDESTHHLALYIHDQNFIFIISNLWYYPTWLRLVTVGILNISSWIGTCSLFAAVVVTFPFIIINYHDAATGIIGQHNINRVSEIEPEIVHYFHLPGHQLFLPV
jgi:hypothetical protein